MVKASRPASRLRGIAPPGIPAKNSLESVDVHEKKSDQPVKALFVTNNHKLKELLLPAQSLYVATYTALAISQKKSKERSNRSKIRHARPQESACKVPMQKHWRCFSKWNRVKKEPQIWIKRLG
jgi:hypothetical protein